MIIKIWKYFGIFTIFSVDNFKERLLFQLIIIFHFRGHVITPGRQSIAGSNFQRQSIGN
jgi:hypothetical protein